MKSVCVSNEQQEARELMLIELRKLNFKKLIELSHSEIDSYTFDTYHDNGRVHPPIVSYCTRCEEQKCNLATDDDSYRLLNISHGAHSSDFISALKESPNTDSWYQEPIMFVYESPSRDYDLYKEVAYKEYRKRPTKEWYWIHKEHEASSYPKRFRGGEYGRFVLSAIQTFKLANVYMTNLVKCGMNNKDGKFKGIASYDSKVIDLCFSSFLKREISILKPRIIFAVGSAVEKHLKVLLEDSPYFECVQQLPHPAGRRRGFRDEHFKAIYFWNITRAMHNAGIITTSEGCNLARVFLEKYDEAYE